MNITLMAHDKKKELMVQFCTAYKSVLMRHNLYATATTGRLVADATGLPITLFLAHSQGGQLPHHQPEHHRRQPEAAFFCLLHIVSFPCSFPIFYRLCVLFFKRFHHAIKYNVSLFLFLT